MTGASIETTLELWASSLREVKARIRPLFSQERVAASAGAFLDGLLGPEQRKTGWMRAESAGDEGPWRQQAILGRGRWDADALRDVVRDYVMETLADDDAVLVIDETGFLKQGKQSCGVGRQYTGSAGKITNCQIGVFASYVSRHGHAFIDRALYLPKAWADDEDRRRKAHVPAETAFATKPQLAAAMIERAIAAGVRFKWLAADSVYGVGALETVLRRAGKGYVLGVASTHPFTSWGREIAIAGTAEKIAQGARCLGMAAVVGRRGDQGSPSLRLGLLSARRTRCGRVRPERHGIMDPRPADPQNHRRRRSRLFFDLVPDRDRHCDFGQNRGPSMGDRG